MKRLIVVSNRVAMPDKSGAGGLAVGLEAALSEVGGLWFGWSGAVSESPPASPSLIEHGPFKLATIDLAPLDHAQYYNGYSNRTLWPLFHSRLDLALFDAGYHEAYRLVNRMFAERLRPLLTGEDHVWVHDYHLAPMAGLLRKTGVGNPLGYFLHIPFPPYEAISALPWRVELARDLCAYDLVGFQTSWDHRNFCDFIRHELGGTIDEDGTITVDRHQLRTGVFPVGIDADGLAAKAASIEVTRRVAQFADRLQGQIGIIGVDRLDYTKGLVERMGAYEILLEDDPRQHGRTCLIQIAAPSREVVPEYLDIRTELDQISGRINGRFAELAWTPVHYFNRSFNQLQLAALYRYCRVGLVTPLRDGMNLVAKEYVAAQNPDDPGVLILSRFAGAAERLDGALIVNPYDIVGMAETLRRAVEMSLAERQARWRKLIGEIRHHDVSHWHKSFLGALMEADPSQQLYRAAS